MTDPVSTGDKQAATRFKPGESGDPKGRPKGSKNKLGEDYLDDLLEVWSERGKAALVTAIQREPMQFAKMVAGILPREVLIQAFSLNVDVDAKDMSKAESVDDILEMVADEAGAEAASMLAQMFGVKPEMIELNPEAEKIPGYHPPHAYNSDGSLTAEYLADKPLRSAYERRQLANRRLVQQGGEHCQPIAP